MRKHAFLLLVVVAFFAFAISAVADYWTWTHTFLPTTKTTTNGVGFFPYFAPSTGQLNPAYGDYNQQNTIQYSPADSSPAQTLFSIANVSAALIRPDGFSYNNDISSWLADPEHALRYSVANLYDENGLTTTKFTSNDAVRTINATGWEVLTQQAESGGWAINTLGVLDETWFTPSGGTAHEAGRLESQIEYALGDFDVTESAPDPNERIYFSAGRYIQSVYMTAYMKVTRPGVTWVGGSDYQGRANAGDVLTEYIDGFGATQYGMFETAYKIAGTMVGDQFWSSGLVWNVYKCYVSTSTASNAPEAAGHTTVRDFLRYVFDITALKVQDVDEDGVFDVGQDLILFSVMSDNALNRATTYNDGWDCNATFAGQFFRGNTMFLYNGASIVTYMDPVTGIFYGQHIDTNNATIWSGKWGDYELTGFALTDVPIPEPSTTLLVVGAGLALGAGVLRKRVR